VALSIRRCAPPQGLQLSGEATGPVLVASMERLGDWADGAADAAVAGIAISPVASNNSSR